MPRNTPIVPKRGRNAIPSKVLIGRTSKGVGSEEILDFDHVATLMSQGNNPLSHGIGAVKEFLTVAADGLFAALENHKVIGPPVPVDFPCTGVDESIARATTAATVTTHVVMTYDIADYLANGTSKICTVTFAAGSLTGSFVYTAHALPAATPVWIVFVEGDASLAGIEIVFCGSP